MLSLKQTNLGPGNNYAAIRNHIVAAATLAILVTTQSGCVDRRPGTGRNPNAPDIEAQSLQGGHGKPHRTAPYNGPHYSELVKKDKVWFRKFSFPNNEVIGEVFSKETNTWVPAKGSVEVLTEEQLKFRPSRSVLANPSLLQPFIAGDMMHFYFPHGWPKADIQRIAEIIRGHNAIRSIDVSGADNADIDASSITATNPEIKELYWHDTTVDTTQLAQPNVFFLQQLRRITFASSGPVDNFLIGLHRSVMLEKLDISTPVAPGPRALLELSLCQDLQYLALRGFTVTSKELHGLRKAHDLKVLAVQSIAVDDDVIASLKTFKFLEELVVNLPGPPIAASTKGGGALDAGAMAKLKQALPKVKVSKWPDSKYTADFAEDPALALSVTKAAP